MMCGRGGLFPRSVLPVTPQLYPVLSLTTTLSADDKPGSFRAGLVRAGNAPLRRDVDETRARTLLALRRTRDALHIALHLVRGGGGARGLQGASCAVSRGGSGVCSRGRNNSVECVEVHSFQVREALRTEVLRRKDFRAPGGYSDNSTLPPSRCCKFHSIGDTSRRFVLFLE